MKRGSLGRFLLLVLALAGVGLSLAAGPVQAKEIGSGVGVILASGGAGLPAASVFAQGGDNLLPPPVSNKDGQPLVRWLLFYSDSCPHCHEVMENFLPGVYEKYGSQVEHQDIEVGAGDNYMNLLGLETKLGVPVDDQGGVPVLVVGDQVLIGADQIPDRLEGLVDQYLARGGVDYQSLENLPTVITPTPSPSVQTLLFYHPEDAGLRDLQMFLSELGSRYGQGLQVIPFDRSDPQFATVLTRLQANLGGPRPGATDPVLLVDRQLIVGASAIKALLPDLVDRYLAEGGKALPSLEELMAGSPTAVVTASATPAADQPAIYMAYFEKAGCQECARTNYDLELVQKQYPQLVVERFSIETEQARSQWLAEKRGVSEDQWLATPMIVVGDDVLIGTEAHAQSLLTVVGKYAASGAPDPWSEYDEELALGRLRDLFAKWGPLTVVGAGLVDGLNPCAFATLVFFISYMTFTGRRGRDILLVGAAFTLGVFLTYLLVGVGLSKIITSLPGFSSWGRWVYLLTGLLCVVLAALTIRDFVRARQGLASEMTLKLPMRLRQQINRVIREGAQMRAFVPMAFLTGFLVSLIELACTGQVYLPAIMLMLSVPEMASRAFWYLLVYCLAFVVPLVVVFALAYLGTTSEQFGRIVGQHTATVKALTAVLFVALALWMAWMAAPLFGLGSPWNWILLLVVLMAIAAGVIATRPWVKPTTKKRRPDSRQPRRRGSRA